jgi:hypothetical protein
LDFLVVFLSGFAEHNLVQGFSVSHTTSFADIKFTTMSVNILTQDDLQRFKAELFEELKTILPKDENLKLKRWLKTDEVKKLLKVSPGTLQTLRINGTLTYTKLGGIIYYDYDHIEKLLQQNLHVATKPLE